MRTFIAIELDPPVKRPLVKLLHSLPRVPDVRWVKETQLHLTLKFLGEVTDTQIAKTCKLAEEVSRELPPFPLRVQGLGCFPSPRNPRVLWCGVDDPTASCRAWVEAIDPLLEELNFKPETRAFTPHITLGRSNSSVGSNAMRSVFETVEPPATGEMTVHKIIVFESKLLPGGAQYRALATVPLGAG